ncbi:MAG: class I SAM-dependent methyltransferase [Gemmatimonadota bacterium]
MTATTPRGRTDYGLDAPGVVRNLLLVGMAGLLVAVAAWQGLLPRTVKLGPVNLDLLGSGRGIGLGFLLSGLGMIYGSRIGKLKRRERLLDELSWTGNEQVLDVGCGRGLLLVAAARRLTTGTATGIDIWRAEDLTDNRPDATLANAAAEGVSDRVRVETSDMRKMPFPDATFDTIVSSYAIHNIEDPAGRDAAVAEISRVLKPGGYAMIDDIRHYDQYLSNFATHGVRLVRRIDSRIHSLFWMLVTFGSLKPGTMVVRKD